MSTNDCPGYKQENRDELAAGCWAEHADGSLIFVEGTEGGRVVYSIFDMDKKPIVEYRDAMAEGAFKKAFSWDPLKEKGLRWTWHDKTLFPWDRIIKSGGQDGTRYASAEAQLTAAEQVRRSREIHRGRAVDTEEIAKTRVDRTGQKAKAVLRRIQRAIQSLDPGDEE